jgi:hypothetical protein
LYLLRVFSGLRMFDNENNGPQHTTPKLTGLGLSGLGCPGFRALSLALCTTRDKFRVGGKKV